MNSVSVACPAKLNLFLRILAREDSGYHQIETLFQAVGLFDQVDARPSGAGISISVERSQASPGIGDIVGDLGDPDDNTVMQAARAFFAAAGVVPAASLALTKRIPAGTGLGGASSDAAGALVALNLLHGRPLDWSTLLRAGGRIGADVPFFCTRIPTALAWGRGDRLLPCAPPPSAYAVLAIPRDRVSTADAYRDAVPRLTLPAPSGQLKGFESSDWRRIASFQSNDFEQAAFSRCPRLRQVRSGLAGGGAMIARLTGSGSAVFGIFAREQDAHSAARRIQETRGVAAALVVPTLTAIPEPRRAADSEDVAWTP